MVALSGKFLAAFLQKIGFTQFIREEGPASHKHKQFTPTTGGIIFTSVVFTVPIGLLLWSLFLSFSKSTNQLSLQPINLALNPCNLLLAFVLLASAAIGFWDDYLKKVKRQNEGLRPKQKLSAQIILSLILSVALQRTSTNFFDLIELKLGFLLFAVFVFLVLAGSMNAVNLTDGLDGLAASILGWSYLGLAGLLVWLKGSIDLQSICSLTWCLALAGVCFGFLRINGHPAKVFMGDTGSFLLGGTLAAIALVNGLEWYLLLLAIVPIWETVSVLLQVLSCKLSKRFLGKDWRPFRMSPFHHHLEMCGWSETKTVWVLSSIQAIFSFLTVLFFALKTIL